MQYLPLFSLPFILTEQIVIKCIKIHSKLRHLLRVKSRALMFKNSEVEQRTGCRFFCDEVRHFISCRRPTWGWSTRPRAKPRLKLQSRAGIESFRPGFQRKRTTVFSSRMLDILTYVNLLSMIFLLLTINLTINDENSFALELFNRHFGIGQIQLTLSSRRTAVRTHQKNNYEDFATVNCTYLCIVVFPLITYSILYASFMPQVLDS